MQAVLVAAGRGTRLSPLTDNTPKCLLELEGRAILDYQLEALKCCGVRELLVVTGHRAEQLEARLPRNARVVYNPFYASSNNLASLWHARFCLEPSFVYLHSDVIFDPAILERLLASRAEVVLAVERKRCDAEDMKVQIRSGRVIRAGKELDDNEADGEFIGLARLSGDAVGELVQEMDSILREGGLNEYFARAVERLARRGVDVVPSEPEPGWFWTEIDTAEDLAAAREAIRGGAAPWLPRGS